MMEHFYCCRCREIKKLHPGSHIFRTGFYRVHTKLGKCQDCAAIEDFSIEALSVHSTL